MVDDNAPVVELGDTSASRADAERRGGSTPSRGTNIFLRQPDGDEDFNYGYLRYVKAFKGDVDDAVPLHGIGYLCWRKWANLCIALGPLSREGMIRKHTKKNLVALEVL